METKEELLVTIIIAFDSICNTVHQNCTYASKLVIFILTSWSENWHSSGWFCCSFRAL
jgi:hypothetical protein